MVFRYLFFFSFILGKLDYKKFSEYENQFLKKKIILNIVMKILPPRHFFI